MMAVSFDKLKFQNHRLLFFTSRKSYRKINRNLGTVLHLQEDYGTVQTTGYGTYIVSF